MSASATGEHVSHAALLAARRGMDRHPCLALSRDPNTLEEQAKLPGMKSQEAAAVRAGPGGMDAFRIVRASIRNMESSVAKVSHG